MPELSLISRLKRLAGSRSEESVARTTDVDSTMDIVVKSALEKGILKSSDLSRLSSDERFSLDWRTLCRSLERRAGEGRLPKRSDEHRTTLDRADTLRRFAADLYGFQSIIICEVGTLVLAHMLRRRFSSAIWRECYRLDCIPVAPHGESLSATGRVMLASPDPARAAVRNFSRSIVPGKSTLIYADASVVSSLESLLTTELPHVASAIDQQSDAADSGQMEFADRQSPSLPTAA